MDSNEELKTNTKLTITGGLSPECDEVVVTDRFNFTVGYAFQSNFEFSVYNQLRRHCEKYGAAVAGGLSNKTALAPDKIAPSGSNLCHIGLIIFEALEIQL